MFLPSIYGFHVIAVCLCTFVITVRLNAVDIELEKMPAGRSDKDKKEEREEV